MFAVFVAVISWSVVRYTASSLSVNRCNPGNHICHGRCPPVPFHAPVPPPEQAEGLCLLDSKTAACVCWLWNPTVDQHLQTLFKCDISSNGTVKHAMCLPPTFCFPPGQEPGCLIIPYCPCLRYDRGAQYGEWHSVIAAIHRSTILVQPQNVEVVAEAATSTVKPVPESREFNLKHLLFLLAFVIAPLCCWCLLTFFHEGKCRKKPRLPATQRLRPRLSTNDAEEQPAVLTPCVMPEQPPTAPKFESPPPYQEATDTAESCLLQADCAPPPSYEDAVQCQWQLMLVPRIPEHDSD